jgi:hypothetical protein
MQRVGSMVIATHVRLATGRWLQNIPQARITGPLFSSPGSAAQPAPFPVRRSGSLRKPVCGNEAPRSVGRKSRKTKALGLQKLMRRRDRHGSRGSALRVVALFAGYALVHSVLASFPAKRLMRRIVGERAEKGLYRGFYMIQAVATTAGAWIWFLRFPDRELYRIEGLAGGHDFPLIEAQGPPPEALVFGQVSEGKVESSEVVEVFRYIRHPENLGFVLILAAFPRMTVNRLTLAVLSLVYAVVGSWHEDYRLAATYGEAFRRYRRRTPMLMPRLRRTRQDEVEALNR